MMEVEEKRQRGKKGVNFLCDLAVCLFVFVVFAKYQP